jgi:hypothetical protein
VDFGGMCIRTVLCAVEVSEGLLCPAKLASTHYCSETQTGPQFFPYTGCVGFLKEKMALEKWLANFLSN